MGSRVLPVLQEFSEHSFAEGLELWAGVLKGGSDAGGQPSGPATGWRNLDDLGGSPSAHEGAGHREPDQGRASQPESGVAADPAGYFADDLDAGAVLLSLGSATRRLVHGRSGSRA